MPYEIQGLKSFAIGAAEIATGKTITRSQMGGSSQWIDFAGPPGNGQVVLVRRRPPDAGFIDAGGTVIRWKVVAFGAAPRRLPDVAAPTRQAAEALLARNTGALQRVPGQGRRRRRVRPEPAGHPPDVDRLEHARPGAAGERDRRRRSAAFRSAASARRWDVVLIICLGFVVPLASLRDAPARRRRRPACCSPPSSSPASLIVAFDAGPDRLVRLSALGADPVHGRLDRRPLRRDRVREGARPRRVLALRAGDGRRPGARAVPARTCGSAGARSSGR